MKRTAGCSTLNSALVIVNATSTRTCSFFFAKASASPVSMGMLKLRSRPPSHAYVRSSIGSSERFCACFSTFGLPSNTRWPPPTICTPSNRTGKTCFAPS